MAVLLSYLSGRPRTRGPRSHSFSSPRVAAKIPKRPPNIIHRVTRSPGRQLRVRTTRISDLNVIVASQEVAMLRPRANDDALVVMRDVGAGGAVRGDVADDLNARWWGGWLVGASGDFDHGVEVWVVAVGSAGHGAIQGSQVRCAVSPGDTDISAIWHRTKNCIATSKTVHLTARVIRPHPPHRRQRQIGAAASDRRDGAAHRQAAGRALR